MVYETLAKVIAWRTISILLTLVITYMYVGSIAHSLILTTILTFIMTFTHFIFEILWDKLVKWASPPDPPSPWGR
jgi:uncharacterized membrane protein